MNAIKKLRIRNVFSWIIIGLLLIRFTPDEGDFMRALSEKIKSYIEEYPVEYLYIHTDREVYSPGEELLFKAYILDIYSSCPSRSSDSLNLYLIDYQGKMVLDSTFNLKNSQAAGKLSFTNTIPEGQYTLIGFTDYMQLGKAEHAFTKKLFISKLIFPNTIIYLSSPDTVCYPGRKAAVEIRLLSPNGKPEKKAYTYTLFINEESTITGEGKTDKTGKDFVVLNLPEYRGGSVVSLEVSVKRSGVIDKNRVVIPVAGFPFTIDFYPEGGSLIHGIESKVGFIAGKYMGVLPDIEGEVLDSDNNVLTNFKSQVNGMGYFVITPDLKSQAKVRITKPMGVDYFIDLPELSPEGVALSYQGMQNDHLILEIQSPEETTLDRLHIIAEQRGEIIWYQDFQTTNTKNPEIPLSNIRRGIVNVTALSPGGIPLSHRSIYFDENREMSVQLKTDQVEYLPKETITLSLDVYNSKGELDIADLSVSVTDANINPHWNNSPDIYTHSLLGPGRSEYPFSRDLFIDPTPGEIAMIDILSLSIQNKKFNWPVIFNLESNQPDESNPENFLNRVLDINGLTFVESLMAPIKNAQFFNKHILKYNQVFPEYFMVNKRYLHTTKTFRKRTSQEAKIQEMLESGVPILDVVRSIKNFQMMGDKIVFFGPNSLLNQDGALIVLDGIKMGTDADLLKSMTPIDIANIEVITDPTEVLMFTGLNNVGIINITSKSGRMEEEEDDQSKSIKYNPTLLWNPYVYTIKESKISFSFESTVLKSSYTIVVQGFNEKGILLYKTKAFSVY